MREFKFRAWSIEKQAWVYFGLDNVPSWVHPAEAEQYTGLYDRNGREIYEGDIINIYCDCDSEYGCSHPPIVCKVIWHEDAMFELIGRYKDTPSGAEFAKYMEESYEVIGNIYENPELLEEQRG